MSLKKVLIANRGEVAVRIIRTASDLGLESVAIYSDDDQRALHVAMADEALAIGKPGVAAYLDGARIVELALEAGCDAIHPGYGFLSENAAFSEACASAGISFVGPSPETLRLFGDKAAARDLAIKLGVPVIEGTQGPTTLAEVEKFFARLGDGAAVMIKALAGGGGRGMRPVRSADELPDSYRRCQAEAKAAFGSDEVYVERLFENARHIEVQVVGDRHGGLTHLWERECSLQRQRQKVVEIAPAPFIVPKVRELLIDYSLRLAAEARYSSLGTFEFLVSASADGDADVRFIEANPRLQVEHTVTEQITGFDLVAAQLQIAGGRSLDDIAIRPGVAPPKAVAIQARINAETMMADGSARPSHGILSAFQPPVGPGIRVDGCGYAGYSWNPNFDSLLAKVIATAPDGDFGRACRSLRRALSEFRISGVDTNITFIQAILGNPRFASGEFTTTFIAENIAALMESTAPRSRFLEPAAAARLAGARVNSNDPLAVIDYGRSSGLSSNGVPERLAAPTDPNQVCAPMLGSVVQVCVEPGSSVRKGDLLVVIEAMKMQHEVRAPHAGFVRGISVAAGDTVSENSPLVNVSRSGHEVDSSASGADSVDLDVIRPDLAEVLDRKGLTLDQNRPQAIERRRKTGQRTARENIADLVDEDSFVEYGALALPLKQTKPTHREMTEVAPGDGLVMGLARVNGEHFEDEKARCAVMSYDYTVYAGTQGKRNHVKMDRMLQLATKLKLPVVVFAEGGGGRGGDTDTGHGGGLVVETFHMLGKMSALVPLVGVVSGRCFAGNAVVLGCCDVIIATRNTTLGMGGPAMVEGGGLGVYRPEEIGPISVQAPNGVVDVVVEDEEEAVAVARKYLSYFQGRVDDWECQDQRLLRHAIPENRLRSYDIRKVIELVADAGSVLELRQNFGVGIITAFMRIEGRPVAVMANNPNHLGGAIDSDAADKAARFMQLCDAFDIPILSLCDTPGNMVGPEHERTGLVRHCCRLFVIASNVTVPVIVVVLRKSYGLGAMGMAAAGFREPILAVSWPTGEFGGMGLEGSIKLGKRAELAAVEDPEERRKLYEHYVGKLYERGKALSNAAVYEIDDVIDPAETRRMVVEALRATPSPLQREGKKRPWIDTW
ncbi:carboxyl transferase domain-containing protein [Microvirga zambiensis]|uniref:carboxyl transferase domain-containing protein n=1 Tax=Microvirga zambiensis TaxID=1402137 RepID=UPI00191D5B00|nr:carboxyl transferase domain-containing protein [Microvirga zambiensis]